MSYIRKNIADYLKGPSLAPLGLAATVLVGAALRLAAMKGRVLLGDEVGTAIGAERTYTYTLTHFSGWSTQPAYYFLARLSSQLLTPDEFALRLPSLLFGLGGILAIYFLAARLFDRRAGMVAALLLALSPYHVFYSQMARGYAMAATLSMVSFICILRLIESPRVSHAVLYVLSTTMAAYCHLGCVGIIPAHVAVALLIAYRRRGEADWRRTLLPVALCVAAVGVLLLCLYYPALEDMLSYRRRFTGQTERGFTLGFVPLLLATYMGGRGWSIYIFSLFAVLGLSRLLRKNQTGALLILAWAAGVFLFYFLNDSRVYPWAYTRFFFITLPALIMLAAGGLVATGEAAANRFGGVAPAAALCLLLLLFISLTSSKIAEISFGKKDTCWPDVISELEASFPPGVPITVLSVGSNSSPYYLSNAWPNKDRVVSARKIIAELKAEGRARQALIPVACIVDVVSFDDDERWRDFVRITNGTSTIIYRRDWRESSAQRRLADLEAITQRIVDYLEERDSELITSDWVYWRRGSKNQKMFASRGSIAQYYSLLAAAQAELGKEGSAHMSRKKSIMWSSRIRMPEHVRASWSMLLPHADFLKISGGYET